MATAPLDLVYDKEWPVFCTEVYPADILADDAQYHQLRHRDENDEKHGARPSGNGVEEKQPWSVYAVTPISATNRQKARNAENRNSNIEYPRKASTAKANILEKGYFVDPVKRSCL